MKINVLGQDYRIEEKEMAEDKILSEADGYCDSSVKKIVIAKIDAGENSVEDIDFYRKKVLRHELIHAFMYESGHHSNCEWGRNEQLIDWVAIQIPKMFKAMKEAECLE